MQTAKVKWPYPITSMEERKINLQAADTASTNAMQRRTHHRMLRAYPRGTRADSSNMDPLAAWRCGVQLVALNLQTNDPPTQLH